MLIFLPVLIIEGGEKFLIISRNFLGSFTEKRLWFILIIGIRGIPPFPGFFIKIEIINSLLYLEDLNLILIFLIRSVGIIYLYIRIIINGILNKISRNNLLLKSHFQFNIILIYILILLVII